MAIKRPPSDESVEKALLWTIMIDGSLTEDIMLEASIDWFYECRDVAKAVYSLALEGEAIDLISVKAKLEEKGKLEKIGGMTGLIEYTEAVTTTSSWQTHLSTLEKLYKQRQLITTARSLLKEAYEENYEEAAEQTMSSISSILVEGKERATNVEDNIALLEQHIEKNKGADLIGWSWGNSFLDRFTGGIQRSKTYRIGSPSWVWKTNLIYDTIPALLEQGVKVMFVSLENSIESTYIKILSRVQGVSPNDIEKGKTAPDIEWIKKWKHSFVLTDQLFNLWEIKREILKVKPDVVILDYIGLVNIKGTDEKSLYNRYADEVKEFVQKNKHLAWIDLSNLNKDDDEERIRAHKWFNGSAKLRNNTDVGIHLFYYSPFYEYKRELLDWRDLSGDDEYVKWFRGKQAITFLISKNRLWPDWEEHPFLINFNEGIHYTPISKEVREKWKATI